MAPSVLLVEDSSPARRNLAIFLERAGYQVAQADTGEHALRLLVTSGNFDVVVSDLRMPGMINCLDVLFSKTCRSANRFDFDDRLWL